MLVQVPKDVPPRSLDVTLDPYFIRVAHRHTCVPGCYLGSAVANAMRQPGYLGLLSATWSACEVTAIQTADL